MAKSMPDTEIQQKVNQIFKDLEDLYGKLDQEAVESEDPVFIPMVDCLMDAYDKMSEAQQYAEKLTWIDTV